MLAWILAGVVAGGGVALLVALRKRAPQLGGAAGELHRQLVALNLGNDAVARRLVEAERKRNPMLNQVACYRAAIARMKR